jgi:hypothetical protein
MRYVPPTDRSATNRFSRRSLLRGAAGSAAALVAWRAGGSLPALARPLPANALRRAAASGDTASTITTFHYDGVRSGWRPTPLTLAGFHRQGALDIGSAIRSQPLILEGWQPAQGPLAGQTADLLYACASGDTVYCFDAAGLLAGNSTPVWTQALGTSTDRNGGYLYPQAGIQSTPVIDPQRRELYVVVMQNDGTGTFEQPHASYYFYVLDVDTGNVLRTAPLYDQGAAGRPAFDGNAQNQRSALTLAGGRVWACFSDFLEADDGIYYGWVVGIAVENPADQIFWCTNVHNVGGGIWGQGGVVQRSDGSLYVSTGNQPQDYPDYWSGLGPNGHPPDVGDYFMAIVRLQPSATGLSVSDWYMPSDARPQSAQDYDLSSGTPCLIENVGGRNLIVHCAKDGKVSLLDADKLGGWGGSIAQYKVFAGDPDGGSRGAPVHMRTPDGVDWVYLVGIGDPAVIAYTMQGGAKPTLTEMWRTRASEIVLGDAPGSLLLTGPAGGATLWTVDCGFDPRNGQDNVVQVLYGIDAASGRVVYASSANPSDDLGKTPHFPTVTPYADSLLVGAWNGLVWYGAA